MRRLALALLPLLLAFAATTSGASASRTDGRWLAEFFGSTHAGGKYSVPTTRPAPTDHLNEGADHIEALGAGILKLWLNSSPRENYPNFTSDPSLTFPLAGRNTAHATMAALLAHPFYREAIGRPAFSTVAFVATEFARVTWRDGLSAAEETAVVTEFREATEYLLRAYANHGKTFIFQNWEGDNLLNLDLYPDQSSWPAMADGLVAYFKARQRGVEEGRAAAGATSASRVWNAIEFNFNWGGSRTGDIRVPEEWTVLNRVVRDGYRDHGLLADLYSWSNWSSKIPGEEWRLLTGVDYMRARVPTSGPFGDRALFLGEFGAYENSFYSAGLNHHSPASDATFAAVNLAQFLHAWRAGLRHAIFWQLYANGLRAGATFSPAAPVEKIQQELVGTWLVRPPAPPLYPVHTYTSLHHRFSSLMDCWSTEDDLSDFGLVHSQAGGWAGSSAPQSWAPGAVRRLYRASRDVPASITYRVEGDLVDWSVTAYLYNGTPGSRLRGYTSADGTAWSEPLSFAVAHVNAPDPALPAWTRAYLSAPNPPPPGTRFLKIEIHAADDTWRTQIGDVRLLSRGLRPRIIAGPPAQLVLAGEKIVLAVETAGRGPLRHRWHRNGVFLRETREPTLELDSATAGDAGSYHVEVGNYAGFTASAAVSVAVAANGYDRWARLRFSEIDLADPRISAATSDPEGDGLPNLLAYALGHDPLVRIDATPALPTLHAPAPRTVSLVFTRVADPGLRYTVEATSDLETWTEVWTSTGEQNTHGPVTVLDGPIETAKRFLRLRVSR